MKNTYLHYFFAILLVASLASCGENASKDKKAQLEKLKSDQAKLSKEIQQLEEEIAKENPDAVAVKAKDVSVKELTPRKFEHYVQTQGTVEAEDNILVSAQAMGVITSVLVTEGQQVSKGQVLAQIDNAVIARNIESMNSQLELANTVFERQKNLWNQKIGTEVQYLQAKTNKESLERQLASLREQNDMMRIKSPINGTVDEITAKIGQNIAPGIPAFRVVNTSKLKLVANVSEAYVTTVKKGSKVVVSIPELNKDIESSVTFVGKNIDVLSRTFVVEVKLPAHTDLRPNMSAVIKVIFHTEPTAIVVPINVIQQLNNTKIVYVAETKGKQMVARKREVTVDGVFDNLAQVKGLNAGDKIITMGYQGLNDGEIIKI